MHQYKLQGALSCLYLSSETTNSLSVSEMSFLLETGQYLLLTPDLEVFSLSLSPPPRAHPGTVGLSSVYWSQTHHFQNAISYTSRKEIKCMYM